MIQRSLVPWPLILVLFVARGAPAQSQEEDAKAALQQAPPAMESITAEDLKTHLEVIASDAFGGRLTATEGQLKAAAYVSDHFEKLGLKPYGDSDGKSGRKWTFGYDVTLKEMPETSGLTDSAGKRLNKFGAWFLPGRGARAKAGDAPEDAVKVNLPLRFVGRVVKDDFKGKDLSSVIPVAIVEMDGKEDEKMTIGRAMMSGPQKEGGRIRAVAAEFAAAKAPAGIVVVKKFNVAFNVACNLTTLYPGKPFVNLGKNASDGMMGAMAPKTRIPMLVVDGEDAAHVLAVLGLKADEIFAENAIIPAVKTTKTRFHLNAQVNIRRTKAVNVCGVLEGRDEALKSEAIVYSAHMDHVGMGPSGEAFNGADDDGSGTVSLLELAEAYAKLKPDARPRRSILFASVSGEELGLWGSEAYAANPTWPIEKLVANINLDMIGRSTEKVPADTIAVTPTFSHSAFSTLSREAALLGQGFGIKLTSGDQFYTRSDHYNFAKRGVPVVFFTDDEHPDYHLPSDDAAKIEFDKMEKIVRLAFLLGFRTAERDERPETIGPHEGWFGAPGKTKPKKARPGSGDEGGKTP